MPELIAPDGRSFRTEDPGTVNRLVLTAGYRVAGEPEPPTVDDILFHPGDHKVADVQAYLAEHPEEKPRIIAEEKAGQARISIIGD